MTQRLAGVDDRMHPEAVAAHVAGSTGDEELPFLLGRLVTDELRANPVDTGLPGWEGLVASSVEFAFDMDLVRTSAGDVAYGVEDARQQLTALTWAFGAGLPEDEWRTVAATLTGRAFGRDDVSRVLEHLGRYVVQDGEGGIAVYRLAHQALADHLRPRFQASWQVPFDPAAVPIAAALFQRYRDLIQAGIKPDEARYLWLHAWQHAAAAGPAGVAELVDMAEAVPVLAFDVALASDELVRHLAYWGLDEAALDPAELAVAVYRGLVGDSPELGVRLASALLNLGVRNGDLGRHAEALASTEEAVDLYRGLAEGDPSYRLGLAQALNACGAQLAELGRLHEALPPTEEAVTIFRALSTANPAHLPDLASGLNNLANRSADLGDREAALVHMEEAVAVYREVSAADAVHTPDLAMSLNNLGGRLADLGRRSEALAPTEEALAIYGDIVDANPAYRPQQAMTFINLGNRLGDLGRLEEALGPSREAVDLYRILAGSNGAHRPHLALALNNLGSALADLSRHEEALVPAREAVDLGRELAAANPGHLPRLAMALGNLGGRLADVGRHEEALEPTQEAANLRRELAQDNDGFLPDLASSLDSLGGRLASLGMNREGLEAASESVGVYRRLADSHPVHRPALGIALCGMALRLTGMGQPAEAVPLNEEAVAIFQEAVVTSDRVRPDLAAAWHNLGIALAADGRPEEALVPSRRAVDEYRALASTARSFLSDLALALANLGGRLRELERPSAAITPLEEAVGLYRDLAESAPAYLPRLASTLSELGIGLHEDGRAAEAVSSLVEATDLLHRLVQESGSPLAELGTALARLSECAEASGRTEVAERAWEEASVDVDDESVAFVLWRRAGTEVSGSVRCAPWLRAAEGAAADPALVAAIRDEARRHLGAAPTAWAEGWREGGTQELPAWLTVDAALLTSARAWMDTATFREEAGYLRDHPELTSESAAVAVEEALLSRDRDEADRLRAVLVAARRDGVDAAYLPLLARISAHEVAFGDPEVRRRAWATEFATLASDEGQTVLRASAASDDPDEQRAGEVALALVVLAAAGGELLTRAMDVLDRSERPMLLIEELTERAEAMQLEAGAVIAWHVAEEPREGAAARIAVALACALLLDPGPAAEHVTAARHIDDTGTGAWIARVARLGATHPEVLVLIPALTDPMPAADLEDA